MLSYGSKAKVLKKKEKIRAWHLDFEGVCEGADRPACEGEKVASGERDRIQHVCVCARASPLARTHALSLPGQRTTHLLLVLQVERKEVCQHQLHILHVDKTLVVDVGENGHDELAVEAVGDAAVARDEIVKVLRQRMRGRQRKAAGVSSPCSSRKTNVAGAVAGATLIWNARFRPLAKKPPKGAIREEKMAMTVAWMYMGAMLMVGSSWPSWKRRGACSKVARLVRGGADEGRPTAQQHRGGQGRGWTTGKDAPDAQCRAAVWAARTSAP